MNPVVNLLGLAAAAALTALLVALRRRRRARARDPRAALEDALKHAWHEEQQGRDVTISGMAGALRMDDARAVDLVERMQSADLVTLENGRIRLTDSGNRHAVQVVRAHRLWERYLADETGVDPERWHGEAERAEHRMSPAEVDALERRLGHPAWDPHGDPIPDRDGRLPDAPAASLADVPPGARVRVAHVEDEPEVVYAQLVAEGVHPGMVMEVEARSPRRIVLRAEGRRFALAPVIARNVAVEPVAEAAPPSESARRETTLADLDIGRAADVLRIAPSCRGLERRRIMDLGLVPGTRVVVERRSPTGGLSACRVRGTLVALRDEQARAIVVEPAADEGTDGGRHAG